MTVEEGHVLNIDGGVKPPGISKQLNSKIPGSSAVGMSTATPTTTSTSVSNPAAASKYNISGGGGGEGGRALTSGVGRGAATFQTSSDVEDGGNLTGNESGGHNQPLTADRVSVMSGASGRSKTTSQLEAAAKLPWYRGVTCKDIKDIMPTVLILLGGILIMIFVIPYAFSSVIKQLEAEEMLEKAREAREKAAAAAEAAAKAAAETVATAAATLEEVASATESITTVMSTAKDDSINPLTPE